MIINLARIDFAGISGSKSKPEETFDVQPTTAEQTITPTEGSVFSGGTVRAVTSAIDNNIVAGNIKEGVTILGVAGTHKGEKPEESFNVQPTTAEQTITPTEGSVFSGGTVHAVTSAIDSNIQPENIKEGVSILGVAGTLSGGSGGDTPDYRYAKGTIDKEGLKAIGWTDEDILTYEQNKPPHYVWQNDQYKVSDENKALYLLDNPDPSSYKNNPNITFVPKKNMESYFVETDGFRDMKYIKGIPFFDTSNTDRTGLMFYNCKNLTTIPQLNTSNVKYINTTFAGCEKLANIPQLDTSSAITMESMFQDCKSLTTIPQLNTSKVTSMQYMFRTCTNLQVIPQLDTSNVTNIGSMFQDCTSLTTIPLLDISNANSMYWMFLGCRSLITIPQLNTSNITNMESTFNSCESLTTIPSLDTSKVTNMKSMLSNCDSLTTVEGIDFSGLTKNLTNLFGYDSVKSKVTRFIVNGKINVSISDNYSIKPLTAIDYDSVKSILAAADRTDNTNAKTLTFNRTIADQNGELAALVASCTSKGWSITGLTIKPREDVILTCSDVVLTDGKVDYVPVTIDTVNDWNIARYDGGGVTGDDWLEIKVYEGSTFITEGYGSISGNWEGLTGKTAGINTANLKVGNFGGIVNEYGDLPAGIKLVVSFGIVDSNNNYYKYAITLERIDGQITTTLHTISPNA